MIAMMMYKMMALMVLMIAMMEVIAMMPLFVLITLKDAVSQLVCETSNMRKRFRERKEKTFPVVVGDLSNPISISPKNQKSRSSTTVLLLLH
jgi:ribosomal protein L1